MIVFCSRNRLFSICKATTCSFNSAILFFIQQLLGCHLEQLQPGRDLLCVLFERSASSFRVGDLRGSPSSSSYINNTLEGCIFRPVLFSPRQTGGTAESKNPSAANAAPKG